MHKPRIIVIEGGDGAGKSTAKRWIIEHLLATQPTITAPTFDATEFEQTHPHRSATANDFSSHPAQFILTIDEPSYADTGAVIRQKVFEGPINQEELAHLYARDRHNIYDRLVTPYIEGGGRWVVQSRGLLSSLTYQATTIAKEKHRSLIEVRNELLRIPGNSLELGYASFMDILVLCTSVEIGRKRLVSNRPSRDQFENDSELQRRVQAGLVNDLLQDPFREKGARFHMLNASNDPPVVHQKILDALTKLIEDAH